MARAKSPVMGLGAAVKNEAIKLSCDVEGKDIFGVLGNKKKGIPMKPCAMVVNKEYSARKLHGVTLMRDGVSLRDASIGLIAANNAIFKNNPASAAYMQTFVKARCAVKNGKSCNI